MGVAVNSQGQGKATQPEAEWRSVTSPGKQLAQGGGGAESRGGSEWGGMGWGFLSLQFPHLQSEIGPGQWLFNGGSVGGRGREVNNKIT